MAVDRSGEWWIGSAPEDIQEFLEAYSAQGYKVSLFRRLLCACGGDRFQVAVACNIVRPTCSSCGAARFIWALAEDWEEAIDEEPPKDSVCPDCGSMQLNLGVGFALYAGLDGVKWLYVGCRCTGCGMLGCLADRKVGAGPVADVMAKFDEV